MAQTHGSRQGEAVGKICGVPFPMRGEGVVFMRLLWPPNARQFQRSFARAFRESERKARAICRTDPDCRNPALLAILPPNRAQNTGYFRRVVGPLNFLICRMICVWVCVPEPVVNKVPQPWEAPPDVPDDPDPFPHDIRP
jgi:hypothetical protein